MTKPVVSVITPAYNAIEFLPAAIESVQDQTDKQYEHIIIDDGSSDGTYDLGLQYAKDDKRIRVLRNASNLGIAGTRNRGLAEARGQYIMWMDADDISMPNRLKAQREFLDENKGVVVVGGYLELFEGAKVLGVREYPLKDERLRRMLHRFSPVAQPAAMLRAQAVKEAGDYDLSLPPAEDLDMTFRLAKIGKLANLSEVVVRYRQSATQATSTKLKVMEKNTFAIRKRYEGEFPPTLADRLYGLAQRAAMLLPPTLKLRLFRLVRDGN